MRLLHSRIMVCIIVFAIAFTSSIASAQPTGSYEPYRANAKAFSAIGMGADGSVTIDTIRFRLGEGVVYDFAKGKGPPRSALLFPFPNPGIEVSGVGSDGIIFKASSSYESDYERKAEALGISMKAEMRAAIDLGIAGLAASTESSSSRETSASITTQSVRWSMNLVAYTGTENLKVTSMPPEGCTDAFKDLYSQVQNDAVNTAISKDVKDNNILSFKNKFGSHYIDSIDYGAVLVVDIDYTSSEFGSASELQAAISASVDVQALRFSEGGGLEAKIAHNTSEATKRVGARVSIRGAGPSGFAEALSMTSVTTVEQLPIAIKRCSEKFAAALVNSGLKGRNPGERREHLSGVPLSYTLKPFPNIGQEIAVPKGQLFTQMKNAALAIRVLDSLKFLPTIDDRVRNAANVLAFQTVRTSGKEPVFKMGFYARYYEKLLKTEADAAVTPIIDLSDVLKFEPNDEEIAAFDVFLGSGNSLKQRTVPTLGELNPIRLALPVKVVVSLSRLRHDSRWQPEQPNNRFYSDLDEKVQPMFSLDHSLVELPRGVSGSGRLTSIIKHENLKSNGREWFLSKEGTYDMSSGRIQIVEGSFPEVEIPIRQLFGTNASLLVEAKSYKLDGHSYGETRWRIDYLSELIYNQMLKVAKGESDRRIEVDLPPFKNWGRDRERCAFISEFYYVLKIPKSP